MIVISGILVGLMTVALLNAYKSGPASLIASIQRPLSLAIAVIISFILLKESMSLVQIIGICGVIVSIVLISIG